MRARVIRVGMTTGRPGGRLHIIGVRVHHGAVGVALTTTGLTMLTRLRARAAAALTLTGVYLAWHDRRDFPWLADKP